MQIKKNLRMQLIPRPKKEPSLVLAGGGISYAEAAAELNEFAERYQIPVVTSLLGQGTIARLIHSSLEWEVCMGLSQLILQ